MTECNWRDSAEAVCCNGDARPYVAEACPFEEKTRRKWWEPPDGRACATCSHVREPLTASPCGKCLSESWISNYHPYYAQSEEVP